MFEMELKLAADAPHDIILMDGSLTSPLINMYKAIDIFRGGTGPSANKLRNDFHGFLISYKKILGLEDANKIWLGIPKYTSRNDIQSKLNWKSSYDDSAILSLALKSGEFTEPFLFANKDAWHIKLPYEDEKLRALFQEVITGIKQLCFLYYKPHSWSRALRIEVPYNIVQDKKKLSVILDVIKTQCKFPSLMEPYALFMADRIVKNIGGVMPSLRRIVTRRMVDEKKVNPDDVFLMMHSYRTESDRF